MLRKHFKRLVARQYKKKTGFNGYIYNFSTDYNAITVSDIIEIHKYLMKKKKKYKNVEICKANNYFSNDAF